mmetsp:Transcript_30766/g.64527  ORF Transcript_30766/g.64527 Transcript_30766/m.64527 type:complete len:160 (+) Transcript_30766:66-545(+)
MALRSLVLLLCLGSCLALKVHPDLEFSKANMTTNVTTNMTACSGSWDSGKGTHYLEEHVGLWFTGSATVMIFFHPRARVGITDFDPDTLTGHYSLIITNAPFGNGEFEGSFNYAADASYISVKTNAASGTVSFCPGMDGFVMDATMNGVHVNIKLNEMH